LNFLSNFIREEIEEFFNNQREAMANDYKSKANRAKQRKKDLKALTITNRAKAEITGKRNELSNEAT
jgi:hypothetical protein